MKLLFALTMTIILVSCASSRRASYYSTQKKIEHGDLSFGASLRVDEYINAFEQDALKKPKGKAPAALSVDYFSTSQPFEKNTSLVQIAVRTRDLTKAEHLKKQALCIVLDVSGSMMGESINDAKKAVVEGVKELKDGTEFTLVLFNNLAYVEIPKTTINQTTRQNVIKKIQRIMASGGTNIERGLIVGYKELAGFNPAAVSRLLLITDGNSNVGITAPKELAQQAKVQYREGAKISTIGIGGGVDEPLLRKIAAEGKGHYYFADKAKTLTKLLREDLSSLTVSVIKGVSLQITSNPGFKINRIYGFDEYLVNGSAKIPFSELNVDDWRILIAEIASDLTSKTIAPIKAELNFKTMNGKALKLTKSPRVKWRFKKTVKKVNPSVARNAVLFSNALALKKISELDSAGSYEDALNLADVQLANIDVAKRWDKSAMFENERKTFLKVKTALEKKTGRQGLSIAQGETETTKLNSVASSALELVKDTLPGPWSLLISLFQLLVD